jgi:hypothetical protein
MRKQALYRIKRILGISIVVFCVLLVAVETINADSGFASGGVSGGSGGASGGASGGGSSGMANGGVSSGSAGARGGTSGGGSSGMATSGVSGGSGGASGGATGGGSSGNAYGGVSGGYVVPSTGGRIPSGCYIVCDKWEYPRNCGGDTGISCNTLICKHWSLICGENRV